MVFGLQCGNRNKYAGCHCRISAAPPPDKVFEEVCAILDRRFGVEKLPEVSAAAKGAEWRPKSVVEIEKRFYGTRQY